MKLAVASVLLAVVLVVDGRKNWKKAHVKQMPLLQPFSSELIHYINTLNTTWRAGRSHLDRLPLHQVKRMCGVLPDPEGLHKPPVRLHSKNYEDIPDEFDARDQWSDCPSIQEIFDQSCCGSCWAFAAVAAISDRMCIHLGDDVILSFQDLLTCCDTCGYGCGGGYPGAAWDYWVSDGLVSDGCKPYDVGPCGSRLPCGLSIPTPPCDQTCVSSFDKSYQQDKHFGSESYSINSDPAQIQTEIMTNGPVEASFTLYEDFFSYKSGVYQHKSGANVGGHAVKILGWGVESGTPYWLAANSWTSGWGEGGFFKILRGYDECGIESSIVAGLP